MSPSAVPATMPYIPPTMIERIVGSIAWARGEAAKEPAKASAAPITRNAALRRRTLPTPFRVARRLIAAESHEEALPSTAKVLPGAPIPRHHVEAHAARPAPVAAEIDRGR